MSNFILLLSILSTFFATENPELTIKISNINKLKGEIKVGIFNKELNFLKENATLKNYSIKVKDNSVILIINDLPKGEYAVTIYHDENSDNQCNRNFIGLPTEGYGFSNNFKPKFGPPKFKDCKFTLTENKSLNIKMIN
ncbi:uncharacterized protein (DUF2141 family) [Flavobacterium sp. PL11]|uniref:DUF2141 domain-containing protein n=1 Tax=Flavobacterium sp. PL11 TaxID=3071717 RepID=UPI002E0CA2F9|nr:uncharacterized protein (DUF2141 family) [Flavobacterium sp. PL11]